MVTAMDCVLWDFVRMVCIPQMDKNVHSCLHEWCPESLGVPVWNVIRMTADLIGHMCPFVYGQMMS